MKILHVLRSPRAEGTVRLVLDWLGEGSLEQEVFSLDSQPPELTESLRRGALWYGEGESMQRGISKAIWITKTIRQTCLKRRPDVVICWVNGYAPWVLLGAKLGGVRSLITHAGNPPSWDLWGKTQTFISTFVTRFVGGRMVCCSRYVADEYARSPGVIPSVLRVVHNCARIDEIHARAASARAGRTDRRPRLVMVATLEQHKDHVTLLRAMPEVLQSIPNAQVWLAGGGSLRAELTSLSLSLGLGGVVEFLGSRHDVPELLGLSDLFVFSTTQNEGLGTVLIEALAADLPIIATDVPACREALEDGIWGRLVEPANPTELAAAIVSEIQSYMSIDLSSRRNYLRRFTPDAMVSSYLSHI